MHIVQTTAFCRNRVIFLYHGREGHPPVAWVRLNLVTMEYHHHGDPTEVLALKIHASALKTWLIEDRTTFEAILKPTKSEPPHVHKTTPPPALPRKKRPTIREGLDNMLKDLLSKRAQ